MSNIRLSICIATLNRANYIGATLDSIISQATEEVEIVIVDGASADNTEEIVHSYQARFPRLHYLRLAAKGGVDQDYCRAIDLAQGDYCWLMTDDDLLKPGAVAAVLEALQLNYSLIVVNAEVCNADLSQTLLPTRLPFQQNRVYPASLAGHQQLLAEAGDYLSFIGGVVIHRAVWQAREKERYFGSEFVHVGVIFQSPLPAPTLALAEPWVIIRYGNAQWTSRYFEVWMFKWPNLIWSLSGFPEAIKKRLTPPKPWRQPWKLLLFRARGVYSLQEYHRLIAPQPVAISKWLAYLIAQLPGRNLNQLGLLYAQLRRLRPLQIDMLNSPFYSRTQ